jgi:MFS family permease
MISLSFYFGIRTVFSVFFVALIDHFKWSRADAAMGQSIALLAYMVMAPISGSLVDRIGPRKVIIPGIILTGTGFLLCTQIQNLFHFYIFFGLMVGVGVTWGMGIAPFTVIISHWFERKRGAANGIAGIGIGIGILLLVPITQYFISYYGWRVAFFILALLVFIIPLPINGIFLRHRPEDMGLYPDGYSFNEAVSSRDKKRIELQYSTQPHENLPFSKLFPTFRFWSVILFPALTTFGIYTVIVHHLRYLIDQGVDKLFAASLFAAVGALTAGFRPFWGWFSDRIGREITFTIGSTCFSSGIFFLLFYQYIHSNTILYLFVLLFGAGWGVTTPMIMSITGDIYKGKNFGLIYGIVEGVIGITGATGAWLAGYIFDQTKSYFWAFIIVILLNIISVILVWLAAPRKFRIR